jgi:hypothetical protein
MTCCGPQKGISHKKLEQAKVDAEFKSNPIPAKIGRR